MTDDDARDDAPDGAAASVEDAYGNGGGSRVPGWAVVLLVVAVAGAFFAWRQIAGGPSEAVVREAVVTTLQEEAPASFLVTGTLTITAETTIRRTESVWPDFFALVRRLDPDFPGIDQGTAQATVRAPGRVSYGFDVRKLKPEDVQVDGQAVTVRLPSLVVHSVEPRLGQMEIKTETSGWMSLVTTDAEAKAREEAMTGVTDALREQAERHLADATQPRVNTARALAVMLRPALEGAGVRDPDFRFRLAPGLTLTPDDG